MRFKEYLTETQWSYESEEKELAPGIMGMYREGSYQIIDNIDPKKIKLIHFQHKKFDGKKRWIAYFLDSSKIAKNEIMTDDGYTLYNIQAIFKSKSHMEKYLRLVKK